MRYKEKEKGHKILVNLCLARELKKVIRFKWQGTKFLFNMLEQILEVGRFKKKELPFRD